MSDFLKQVRNWQGWRAPPEPWQVRMLESWARYWPLFVLAVGIVLYLPFLAARPLRFEEGRRALQVLEMLDGGAWWHLKFIGTPYVNKPPFTPWLMASMATLRGSLDEVAVRLPGVLATLTGALAAGLSASTLTSGDRRVAGLCAGLAFLCCVQILLKARIGETDVTATVLCGIALALWLWGRSRGRFGVGLWAAITAVFACAALTKGPIPIVFSALPMIIMPLIEKKPREAVVAGIVLLVAHIPMLAWAWSNFADAGIAHWASEMRIGPERDDNDRLIRLLHLSDLPASIVYQLPFLPAALALVSTRSQLPQDRRWVVDALLLAAVPMAVLTTVLPVGRTRYSMPASWPLAVMAGIWISIAWRRLYFAHFIIGAGLSVAVIIQIVQIGIMDGRTGGQKQLRADVAAFSEVMKALPPGPVPVVWERQFMNENILFYAHRKMFDLGHDELDCRTGGDYLVGGVPDQEVLDASPNWRRVQSLADWGILYRRVPEAAIRDCRPRNAPA